MYIHFFLKISKVLTIAVVLIAIISNQYAVSNPMPTEIGGLILDYDTKKPVENVTVKIEKTNYISISNQGGRFAISELPAGEYTITFSRIGYRRESRKLKIDDSSPLEIIYYLTPTTIIYPSIVVTGKPYNSKFQELSEETNVLKGRELQQSIGQTLATTLKSEVGLAVRSMGPAPARPVIRGLGGSHVIIENDGFRSNDLSATSPDHAVTVDPYTAEQIEIIRGPKSLLSTSSTLGGIVNVINNNIPLNVPAEIIAEAAALYETANNGYVGSLGATIPFEPLVLKGGISHKKTNDISSPGKLLENTSAENLNYRIGGSFLLDDYIFGASVYQFDSKYGIPGGFVGAHPKGVNIEMLKRSVEAKAIFHFHHDIVDNIITQFGRSYYRHIEYESNGSIGAEFVFRELNANAKLNHHDLGPFNNGTFGLSLNSRESKMGGYVFTPDTWQIGGAAVIYEDMKIGSHYLQFALRYDFEQYTPQATQSNNSIGIIRERTFHLLSGSVSIMHETFADIYTGIEFSRSSRAPTIEELYSEGPHLASYSFEIGNPDLKTEQGWGFELFSFYKNSNVFASANLYYYPFESYIFPRNTGDTNYAQLLPIYASTEIPAHLMGFEFKIDFRITNSISVSNTSSFTYGEESDSKMPLPMIPPFKTLTELKYKNSEFNAALILEAAAGQKRVNQFEQPTDAYWILTLQMQYLFEIAGTANSISLSAENIFNTIYRNHLSRIKSILPEPGRNLKLFWRIFI